MEGGWWCFVSGEKLRMELEASIAMEHARPGDRRKRVSLLI